MLWSLGLKFSFWTTHIYLCVCDGDGRATVNAEKKCTAIYAVRSNLPVWACFKPRDHCQLNTFYRQSMKVEPNKNTASESLCVKEERHVVVRRHTGLTESEACVEINEGWVGLQSNLTCTESQQLLHGSVVSWRHPRTLLYSLTHRDNLLPMSLTVGYKVVTSSHIFFAGKSNDAPKWHLRVEKRKGNRCVLHSVWPL